MRGCFRSPSWRRRAHFGNGGLYLERLIERGHHIEIQIAADRQGNVVHLGERECSIQRRHQKMIEESPSPLLSDKRRARDGPHRLRRRRRRSATRTSAPSSSWSTQDGNFYFLEMNTRLQVEHPVTELVTGIDLVKLQIALAAGEPLPFRQQDVAWRGHAIECRVTSEDPARGFAPDAGHIHTAHFAGGPWVRVDTHVFPGYTTPPYYDSLLAKVIVWGRDRSEAIARMRRALDETADSAACKPISTTWRWYYPTHASRQETSTLISWNAIWPKCSRWTGT